MDIETTKKRTEITFFVDDIPNRFESLADAKYFVHSTYGINASYNVGQYETDFTLFFLNNKLQNKKIHYPRRMVDSWEFN